MQDIIDVTNHIIKYSQVYNFDAEMTDLVKEEVLDLCSKHGEDFIFRYIESYLSLASGKVS
jgi:hypothetical protein